MNVPGSITTENKSLRLENRNNAKFKGTVRHLQQMNWEAMQGDDLKVYPVPDAFDTNCV